MASDQDDIVFTLVTEIVRKVLKFNGNECIQYINQDKLYFRVDEMLNTDLNSVDPANIVEILTSELIIFILSKKEEDSIVMDELTDEARILNSVDFASLIPQERTIPSFEAERDATHSTSYNRNVQKKSSENMEKRDSNEELYIPLNVASHSTYQDVFDDDSSSSSDTNAAHVRTGAIPKRRIERKKRSSTVDSVDPQDQKMKGYYRGNRNNLEHSFETESRHNTGNVNGRDSTGIFPSGKLLVSEAVSIKPKVEAAEIKDESSYSDHYQDSSDNEDESVKVCFGMTNRKENINTDFSIDNVSNLSETTSNPSVDSVHGSQSAANISEALEDDHHMAADQLPSDLLKLDSDDDTQSTKSHGENLFSSHSESEFDMCDASTDTKNASSCHSVSGKSDVSVHSTSTSADNFFKSLKDETSVYSLLPTAGISHEKESLKLRDCEGENDDTCEQFSMLSGASSLDEFSSSVAGDNLLHESSQDDARSISLCAIERDDSDVLLISTSEHSSNDFISILQVDREDTEGFSALNDDSHNSSVMIHDSPISMDGSPLGQKLLENSPDDSSGEGESSDSLFMHSAVDKPMAQTSQAIAVPTGRTKHRAYTRSSVNKLDSKDASSALSSTYLTKGSNAVASIEIDDEPVSLSDEKSEPFLMEVSVKKKVTAHPSKILSPTGSQIRNANAATAKLSSAVQSLVVDAAATTTSPRAAGQINPKIIKGSAPRDSGLGYKLHSDDNVEAQITEHIMADVKFNAGTSTIYGSQCIVERAIKKWSTRVQPEQEDWMKTHCKTLDEFFPNVDENYLFDRCQEVIGSDGRFEALLNELLLIENKPPKVLGAGTQLYHSPKSHIMNMLTNSPNRRRAARSNEDVLDIETTTVDGMPLFDWLQREEYGAAEAAPRPEEEVLECGCCYSSYTVEEMRHCQGEEVHLFCHNCIRSYCENQIGQSKYEMHCLSVSNCSALFSASTLLNVLPTSMYMNLMANQQAEEITAANIDDLETCPFCPFSIIFDNKVTVSSPNIVFRCDNRGCGKSSCRLCKKADHSPAKCEEVRAQTDARTHLENEMTEAMVSFVPAKSSGWGFRSFLPFWRSGPSTSEPQQQQQQQQQPLQQPASKSLDSSEVKGFQDPDESVSSHASVDLASAPSVPLLTGERGGTSLDYHGRDNGTKITDTKRSVRKSSDPKIFGPESYERKRSDQISSEHVRSHHKRSICKRSDHKSFNCERSDPNRFDHKRSDSKGSDYERANHKRSDDKRSDHKKSNHKRSDHKRSDHKRSDHKRSDHKRSDQKRSDHKKSDCEGSDCETSNRRSSCERCDHKRSDGEESNHKRSDYKRSDYKRSDYKRSDHKRSDHKRSDHKRSDHKRSDNKRSDQKRSYYERSNYERSNHVSSDCEKSDRRRSDHKKSDPRDCDQNSSDYRESGGKSPGCRSSHYRSTDRRSSDGGNGSLEKERACSKRNEILLNEGTISLNTSAPTTTRDSDYNRWHATAPAGFARAVTIASMASAASAVANMAGYRTVGGMLSAVGAVAGAVGRGQVSLGTIGATAGAAAERGEPSLTNGGNVTAAAGQSMPPRRSGNGPRLTIGLDF